MRNYYAIEFVRDEDVILHTFKTKKMRNYWVDSHYFAQKILASNKNDYSIIKTENHNY